MNNRDLLKLEEEVDWLITAYKEEKAIVTRIWEILGNPSYEELNGRSIYDLISEIQKEAKMANDALYLACQRISDSPQQYHEANSPNGWVNFFREKAAGEDFVHPLCEEHAQLGAGA